MTSLPLMGIGNEHRRLSIGHHVGRSLPLMGIGNDVFSADLRHDLELITPHGDRELGSDGHNTAVKTAHYPSWGSGTVVSSTGMRGGPVSLPLMGIGNQ